MAATMQFRTAQGVPMTARVVFKGDTVRGTEVLSISDAPVVEFYDLRHVDGFTVHGQPITYYDAHHIGTRGHGPLALDLGVPSWHVDAMSMELIAHWLAHHLATMVPDGAASTFEPF